MEQGGTGWQAVGPHAVFGLDATGRCTHSTGPALSHMGLHPGELVGTNLFDLYRDDLTNVAALKRVLAGESFSIEREFEGRLLSTYFEPVLDSHGAVTGALGVTTDITEQRSFERQLRAARQRADLLASVSGALSRELRDPEALLRIAVRAVTEAVADVGQVWVSAAGAQDMELRATWRGRSESGSHVDDPGRSLEQGVSRLSVSAVGTMSTASLVDFEADDCTRFPAAAELGRGAFALRVPLRSGDRLLGVVDVARESARDAFSEEEIDLVSEVAERCALALDHATLLNAHQEAREQLVKFQALADASDNLIAITDDEDRTVYINPRVRASGLHLTGRVWGTAASAHIDEAVRAALREGLDTSGRWSGDVTVATADRWLTAQVAAFRLYHPDTGEPLGTAWIGEDVTELRETETALRAANSDLMQFKALVDASPDFIAIADMQGSVQYVNPGGRALVGMAPDVDVTTTTIADYASPEGLVHFHDQVVPAVLANGHWEGETALRSHRGGPAIPVATSTFLVRDATTREPFALATVQRDISERLAAETALHRLAEERQALLTRLVDAQEAERSSIAADVHDDPVQACAAVELDLQLLRRQAREHAPQLLGTLDALQATVSGATARLRALLFDLEPPDLGRGLAPALSRAAQEIFASTGVRWAVDGAQEPDIPATVRAIGYRIAKEAMTNVRKHARARHVTITVDGRDGGMAISVEDDGVGMGAPRGHPSPGHRGLLGMHDRATVAGGRCTISNGAAGGTVVTAWLPGALDADADDR